MEGEEAGEPALEQQLALALHRVPEAVEQLHQRLLPAVQVAHLLDAPPGNRARKRRDELSNNKHGGQKAPGELKWVAWFQSDSVADPGCLSRIRLFLIPDPNFFPSRIPDLYQRI